MLSEEKDSAIDAEYERINQMILSKMIEHLTEKQLVWLSFYNPMFGIHNDRSIQLNKILSCIYSIFEYSEHIQKYKSMFGLHLMYIQYSVQHIIKKNIIHHWFETIRNPQRIDTLKSSTMHNNHYLYHFPNELFTHIYHYL